MLADEYREKTYDIIREIKPLLEPRYQLSLEIIFDLYLMVFERIDLKTANSLPKNSIRHPMRRKKGYIT